jgi:WD40-like Beta Propeller Repeat
MKTLCCLVLILGTLLLTCSKSTDGVSVDNIPDEDLGTFLQDYGMNAHWVNLIWSKNTNELFTAGQQGIQAIDLSNLTVRTIYTTDGIGTPQASSMVLSNDGNTIYYMLTGPGSHGPLYSISINGQNRQLLDSRECTDLCLSSDDSHLAYWVYYYPTEGAVDSLFIYDIVSGDKKFICIGRPIKFSPNSQSLLYSYETHSNTSQYTLADYSIISIENGEVMPVSFGVEYFYLYDIYWDESGIYIHYSPEAFQCVVRNITTNETIYSWGHNVWTYSPSYTFSPRGQKIAFWLILDPIKLGLVAFSIHVIDFNSESDTRIAYSKKECETFAFSPDELKMAYVFGQSIYMKDIP